MEIHSDTIVTVIKLSLQYYNKLAEEARLQDKLLKKVLAWINLFFEPLHYTFIHCIYDDLWICLV